MRDLVWTRWRRCAALAFALVLVMVAGTAAAQDSAELTPSFGNGKLTISGAGFKAREAVTIIVTVEQGKRQLTTTADSQGNFELATAIAVGPGQSLELEARGDQGTTIAVTTAVPTMLPNTAAPGVPTPLVIGVALVILTAGIALRCSLRSGRSAHTRG